MTDIMSSVLVRVRHVCVCGGGGGEGGVSIATQENDL